MINSFKLSSILQISSGISTFMQIILTKIIYLKTTFLSESSLKSIKTINPKERIADPPLLKKGRGMPITGAKPITIAIFIMK